VLRPALAAEEIPLEVLSGGEIAMWRLATSTTRAAHARARRRPVLLVESPFRPRSARSSRWCSTCSGRGHRVLLAHPERCPAFHRDPERLQRLVDAACWCRSPRAR
jgi:protein-tyrosine phosphatase